MRCRSSERVATVSSSPSSLTTLPLLEVPLHFDFWKLPFFIWCAGVALGVAAIELAIVLFACCLGKRFFLLDLNNTDRDFELQSIIFRMGYTSQYVWFLNSDQAGKMWKALLYSVKLRSDSSNMWYFQVPLSILSYFAIFEMALSKIVSANHVFKRISWSWIKPWYFFSSSTFATHLLLPTTFLNALQCNASQSLFKYCCCLVVVHLLPRHIWSREGKHASRLAADHLGGIHGSPRTLLIVMFPRCWVSWVARLDLSRTLRTLPWLVLRSWHWPREWIE